MSARIGGEVMKKQNLISSSGAIIMKKEVNMSKVKKNLKGAGSGRRRRRGQLIFK